METMTKKQKKVLKQLVELAEGDSDLVADALKASLDWDGLTVDIEGASDFIKREMRLRKRTMKFTKWSIGKCSMCGETAEVIGVRSDDEKKSTKVCRSCGDKIFGYQSGC
jgi:DNA-directed RNA polymerase subunit RPC12/RpoP